MEKDFYTVPEVAGKLHVDPRTVREWIKLKKLRALKVGGGPRGEYRIARADFLQFQRDIATMPERKGDLVEA